VWRRRALGRKPSASVRLDAAAEALQNSMTCVQRTPIHSSVGSRPTGNRPEPRPSARGHPLGVPIPRDSCFELRTPRESNSGLPAHRKLEYGAPCAPRIPASAARPSFRRLAWPPT